MNYYFCFGCYGVFEHSNLIECPDCDGDIMSIKQTDYLGLLYDEACDCNPVDDTCLAVWLDGKNQLWEAK